MTGERWMRLEGILDPELLRDKHVVVVGLGSGGSTVALELAKTGVGRFTLIDPDRIEERNVVRHECDDRYLGWPKAEAVADLIRFRNPSASIEAATEDALALGERLDTLVREADLAVGCTDAEAPKHLLNRLCTAAGTPAGYGGVYAGGVGGEVIACPAGPEDPCYACVTSVLKEAAPVLGDGALDYGVAGGLREAPGLGMDVRMIALIHARVCLDALLGREASGTVVLFGTRPVEGLFPRPFASAIVDVAVQRDCLVCTPMRGSRRPPRASARSPR